MKLLATDKPQILTLVLQQLTHELNNCIEAANNAHLAAVDEQSVAETQYDTLAIESAYLAEGQSRRLVELKKTIGQLKSFTFQPVDIEQPIKLGGLIQFEDSPQNKWLLMSPTAGGYKVMIGDNLVTLVTPQSPLGKAILNKYLDDDISYHVGNKMICHTIITLI
ncbi:hypothetical protein [Thalassotalea agariperforans]